MFEPKHTEHYCLLPSPRSTKKLRAVFLYMGKKQYVDFGHVAYEDFTQHKDTKRKRNYLTRSDGILNKQGLKTKDDPLSANYWARRILWDSREDFSALT